MHTATIVQQVRDLRFHECTITPSSASLQSSKSSLLLDVLRGRSLDKTKQKVFDNRHDDVADLHLLLGHAALLISIIKLLLIYTPTLTDTKCTACNSSSDGLALRRNMLLGIGGCQIFMAASMRLAMPTDSGEDGDASDTATTSEEVGVIWLPYQYLPQIILALIGLEGTAYLYHALFAFRACLDTSSNAPTKPAAPVYEYRSARDIKLSISSSGDKKGQRSGKKKEGEKSNHRCRTLRESNTTTSAGTTTSAADTDMGSTNRKRRNSDFLGVSVDRSKRVTVGISVGHL